MRILPAFLSSLFAVSNLAAATKLFRVQNRAGSSSYVLSTTRCAWVASPTDLPMPVRRALQKSKSLVFAHDFWTPRADVEPPLRQRADAGYDVTDALGAPARGVLARLGESVDFCRLNRLRPGLVLTSCLAATIGIHECRQDDLVMSRTVGVGEDQDVCDLARAILGAGEITNLLEEAVNDARRTDPARRVKLPDAVRLAAARAGLEPEAILATTEAHFGMSLLLETVTIDDLERGLIHLGDELAAAESEALFRRRVLANLTEVVRARYFETPVAAIAGLHATDVEMRLKGLEAFRFACHHASVMLARTMVDRLATGGLFLALDIATVEGDEREAGLHAWLADTDLVVSPVEMDCERAFH